MIVSVLFIDGDVDDVFINTTDEMESKQKFVA